MRRLALMCPVVSRWFLLHRSTVNILRTHKHLCLFHPSELNAQVKKLLISQSNVYLPVTLRKQLVYVFKRRKRVVRSQRATYVGSLAALLSSVIIHPFGCSFIYSVTRLFLYSFICGSIHSPDVRAFVYYMKCASNSFFWLALNAKKKNWKHLQHFNPSCFTFSFVY